MITRLVPKTSDNHSASSARIALRSRKVELMKIVAVDMPGLENLLSIGADHIAPPTVAGAPIRLSDAGQDSSFKPMPMRFHCSSIEQVGQGAVQGEGACSK